MLEKEFTNFIEERNGMLLRLDPEEVRAYCRKYGVVIPDDETAFWAGLHKARLHVRDFPEEEREKSRAWLAEHGYGEDV